jgi:hypothetical protein
MEDEREPLIESDSETFNKFLQWASSHPVAFCLIGIWFWPIGTLIIWIFAFRVLVKRENELFMGLDYGIAIALFLAGFVWPFLPLIQAASSRKRNRKAGS